MIHRFSLWKISAWLTFAMILATAAPIRAAELMLLDADWQFSPAPRGSAPDNRPAPTAWRSVDLPHDWSIESRPSPDAPSAGGGGFFATGTGWYRKSFPAPKSWGGKRVSLEFEGVSANATVFLNGAELGRHRYAYTPFTFELTSLLRSGQLNTLEVRVENEPQPNSRFYSGSGIYRHVWLRVSDARHVEPSTMFVRTLRANSDSADALVSASVRNETDSAQAVVVELSVLDANLRLVASSRLERQFPPRSGSPFEAQLSVSRPKLWSPNSPTLYHASVRVLVAKRETDRIETPFGIRVVSVSAETGLLLNGQPIKLLAGNVHHDNGILGAASFDRAEQRKAEILKAAGFNAVRTSHNPPSAAFLAACDRLGLLVLDEAFDGWAKPKTPHGYSEHFAEDWPNNLEAMIRRDRNHPSVVMWSIGNEVYERGAASGVKLAKAMVDRIHELDTTRPITAGLNGMGKNGHWSQLDPLFAQLDVAGYNYEFAQIPEDRARLPQRVILGTESYVKDVWPVWTAIRAHPNVIGDFVWSATDYLGEAGIGRVYGSDEKPRQHWEGSHFPWHGAACGDIDLLGERKPLSHYRAIVWGREEGPFLAVEEPTADGRPWNVSAWAPPPLQASWTWPGFEKRPLRVEVYSRASSVRLYLNGRVVGEQPAGEEHECKAVFSVPYAAGSLKAVELENGAEARRCELTTADAATRLELTADRKNVTADGGDLVYVSVNVTDDRGRRQTTAHPNIHYKLTGPGTIIAIGNADLTSATSYQDNPHPAYRGHALVIIRTQNKPGKITLTATAEGLKSATVTIVSKGNR